MRSELSGWSLSEIGWLVFCCAIIVILSWRTDTAIGILSATTGVINVILNGKGKVSTYLFGLINVVLYTYISFSAKFYGMAALYALYFLPMNIYGFYSWSQHIDATTCEVEKRRVDAKWRWRIGGGVALCTAIIGAILWELGGNLPFIDGFITALSVVAMIAAVKRCMEQWVLWLIADIITVVMWSISYARGEGNIATLLMWILYVAIGFVMYFKWSKEATQRAQQELEKK